MNIGQFTRLPYDNCAYPDRLTESTGPISYIMSTDRIYNCDRCLTTLGPRSGYMGHGVSTTNNTNIAEAQGMVDLESVLSNRNVKESKCKKGKVNPINPITSSRFKTHNSSLCDNKLNIESTRLHYSGTNRDVSMNRFYNTIHHAQDNIFWDFSINSSLEEKDNHVPSIANPWTNMVGPTEDLSPPQKCSLKCSPSGLCGNKKNKCNR